MNPILRPRIILPNRGFNPPAAGNLLMWFDAQQISGVDGSSVAQWSDRSGHGNHATQGTSGNRPTLKRSQLGTLSAVKFNVGGGTTQYLDLPNVMGAPSGAEYFAVFQADADPSASANSVGMLTLTGVAADQALPFTNGNIYETFGTTTNVHTSIPKALNVASTARLINTAVESGHCTIRLNGTPIHDSSDHTVSFAGATQSVGRGLPAGSTYWRGYVFEILVYNTRLTYAQRAVVQNYLAVKYGISSAVDSIAAVTPASFSGLAAWYKADQLVLNDGDPVSTWADQSGNSRDITAAGATRPTYKSAGLNSKPSVRFTTSNSLSLAADLTVAANTSLSGIVVASYSADCTCLGHASDNVQFRARRGGVNVMGMFANGGNEAVSATFARAVGAAYAGTWRRNVTLVGNFFNNGDAGAVTSVGSAQFRWRSLGGNPFGISMAGDISEFCFWSGTYLTDAQVMNLYETYFRDRWALP
jgi:hypothetical protein